MPVSTVNTQYSKHADRWNLIRDVLNSDVESYIVPIDSNDSDRTKRYRGDAIFTNFTTRTKDGLVGAVFRKEIQVDISNTLEYLLEDATGDALPLTSLTREVEGEVIAMGRYGLLVDFPASEDGLTAQEVSNLNLKARINQYTTESIINWGTDTINGLNVLSLVVLKESIRYLDVDGFTWIEEDQYRVLRLIEGAYIQQVYNQEEELVHEYTPRDFAGNTWGNIPFTFVGADNNDSIVDPSPMYGLAKLNIGHYRNSADYEESVHIAGQPTLIISTEMSAEQFAESNPNGVLIGARRGHNLGPGGSAQLLQANPNQLADVAMQRKEEQAVMIGARLVMQAGSNETAEAARIKHSGENSVLSTITLNVNVAMRQCLNWVGIFMGTEEEVVFEINRQFFDVTLDPQLIMAQLQLFNNGVIAQQDIRDSLRKTGTIKEDRTDEEIDSDVEEVNPIDSVID